MTPSRIQHSTFNIQHSTFLTRRRCELQYGVPVARSSAHPEFFLDHGVAEFRRANAVGIDDVELPAVRAKCLASFDRAPQRVLVFDAPLEKHHQEMPGIALRLGRKRIPRDHRLPFLLGTHEESRLEAETLEDFLFEE